MIDLDQPVSLKNAAVVNASSGTGIAAPQDLANAVGTIAGKRVNAPDIDFVNGSVAARFAVEKAAAGATVQALTNGATDLSKKDERQL